MSTSEILEREESPSCEVDSDSFEGFFKSTLTSGGFFEQFRQIWKLERLLHQEGVYKIPFVPSFISDDGDMRVKYRGYYSFPVPEVSSTFSGLSIDVFSRNKERGREIFSRIEEEIATPSKGY